MKHYIYIAHYSSYGLIILLCGLLFASLGYSQASDNNTVSIGINIINSYSGTLTWSDNNTFYFSGGYQWTNSTYPELKIEASTGGYFQVLDEYNIVVWSGNHTSGSYTYTMNPALLSGDGLYSYKAIFHDIAGEPLFSNSINVIRDTTAPSIPILSGPYNNTLITNDTATLSWGSSTDGGIGLSGYILHLSLTPDFSSAIELFTTDTSIILGSNILPQGTIFWYIESKDNLGNSSSGDIHFFHYQQPSTIQYGGGNGGGYTILPTLPSGGESEIPIWYVPEYDTNDSIHNTDLQGDKTTNELGREIIITTHNNTRKEESIRDNNLTTSIKNQLLLYYHNTYERLCQIYGQCLVIPNQDIYTHSSAPNSKMYEDIIITYKGLNPIGLGINIISFFVSIILLILSYHINHKTKNKIIHHNK